MVIKAMDLYELTAKVKVQLQMNVRHNQKSNTIDRNAI